MQNASVNQNFITAFTSKMSYHIKKELFLEQFFFCPLFLIGFFLLYNDRKSMLKKRVESWIFSRNFNL